MVQHKMPKSKLAPVCNTKYIFVNYCNKGYQAIQV